MIKLLILLWLFLLAMPTPQDEQEEEIDIKTRLNFKMPQTLAGIKLTDTQEYEDSKLGWGFQYSGEGIERLDVYVYDMGIVEIPTGCENEKVEEQEKANKLELESMVEKGYLDKATWKSKSVFPKTGNIRFLRNTYEISFEDGGEIRNLRSDMFLTGFMGKFVKVRASIDKENIESGIEATERFVNSLSKYLERTWKVSKKDIAKDILAAIKVFRKDPESKNGVAATAKIFSFTMESPDVEVTIDQTYCQWILDDTSDKIHIITVAYFAGNIKPQLEKGIAKNHAYEGVVQVLETYEKLRRKKAIDPIESIESLKKQKRTGKLRGIIRESENKDENAEADKENE